MLIPKLKYHSNPLPYGVLTESGEMADERVVLTSERIGSMYQYNKAGAIFAA